MTAVRDRAIAALARIIDESRDCDARATALECLARLDALGYRPVEALAPATWPQRPSGSGLPSPSVRADVEAARERMAAATAAMRSEDPPAGPA
jgi:hypothetical protein